MPLPQAIPKEEKLNRLFMANQCEHFRAVVYLLDKNAFYSQSTLVKKMYSSAGPNLTQRGGPLSRVTT